VEERPKHKQKQRQPPSLDFVTARTVDECRAVLERRSGQRLADWLKGARQLDWQRVHFSTETHFSVERLVEESSELMFVGDLFAVKGGTLVRGELSEKTLQQAAFQEKVLRLFWLFVIGALISAFMAQWGVMVLLVLLTALIETAEYRRWKKMQEHIRDLVAWVRDQLYVLPGEEHETENKT
jgi:hypothetical protein